MRSLAGYGAASLTPMAAAFPQLILLSVSVCVRACVRVCVLCVFLSISLPSLSHQREQAATAYKRALKIRPAYNRAVENLRRLEPQAAGQ